VQEAPLFRWLSELYEVWRGLDATAVEAAARVGLGEFRDLRISKCSKGMKQKVGIAQCLINNPKLVFLDEPTRGLDPLAVKEFRDVLVELNKKGATIVLNSHVLSEIEMICNRAAIMNKGKVVAQDEMARLRGTSLEAYTVECAPFDPLPQFWARHNAEVSSTSNANVATAEPGIKLDIFGRSYVDSSALSVYAQAASFDPLPQLWLSHIEAVNPMVAKTGADSKVKG